jgi:hypothetical protein
MSDAFLSLLLSLRKCVVQNAKKTLQVLYLHSFMTPTAAFSCSLNLKFNNIIISWLKRLSWRLYWDETFISLFPIIFLKYKHFGRWLCSFHEVKYKNCNRCCWSVGWNKSVTWICSFLTNKLLHELFNGAVSTPVFIYTFSDISW